MGKYLKYTIVFLFTISTLALTVSACSGPAVYGKTPDPAIEVVRIADIQANPDAYIGKAVALEGKIVSECGSGCWFVVEDGSGKLYVDLAPSNLAIPQKVGSKTRVEGKIQKRSGELMLVGTSVKF